MSRKKHRRIPKGTRRKTGREPKATPPPNAGPDGRKIWEAMKAAKIKGKYQDHVLFVGDQLVDRYGVYRVLRPDAPPDQHILVVHKSKLKSIVGKEWAEKFWDFKWKRRTSYGLEAYLVGRQARKAQS